MVRTRLVTGGVGGEVSSGESLQQEKNNIDLDLCYYHFSTHRK